MAEALAAIGAPTLLATHFSDLAQLADLYPQCRAWHFKVDTSKQSMEYLWELEAGTSDDRHYGLALAEAVQVPEDVLERAKAVVSGKNMQIVLSR